MIELTIPFLPRAAQRARSSGRGGRHYDPEQSARAKANIAAFLLDKKPARPLGGPVSLAVEFFLPRPAKPSKTHRVDWKGRPCKKPDLSNLLKLLEDAINDVGGIWADDAYICAVTMRKSWGDPARTVLKIAEMQPAAM